MRVWCGNGSQSASTATDCHVFSSMKLPCDLSSSDSSTRRCTTLKLKLMSLTCVPNSDDTSAL